VLRYPGIRIHDTRVIRSLEVFLQGGSSVGCGTAVKQAVEHGTNGGDGSFEQNR
jgi:hypothetical protein